MLIAWLLLPEFFLGVGIICLLLLGSQLTLFKQLSVLLNSNKVIYNWSILLLLSIIYLYYTQFNFITPEFIINIIEFFQLNILNWSFKLLNIILLLLLLISSWSFLNQTSWFNFEFLILLFFVLFGSLILMSSMDFLILYIVLELQALCLYTLTGYNRISSKAMEASLKYFIQGTLSSGILIFGLSFLYGYFGTVNFIDIELLISMYLPQNLLLCFCTQLPLSILNIYVTLYSLAFLMILFGFFFKLAAVPFHFWAPDVYESIPLFMTAFFAVIPKLGIFIALIHVYLFINKFFFFANINFNNFLFIIIGLCSLIVGALGALYQTNIRRLFAFSAINNIGLILFGFSSEHFWGLLGSLIYFLIYILLVINFFLLLIMLYERFQNEEIETLEQLTALFKNNSLLSLLLGLLLFSFAGVPPLAGFYSKFYLILCLLFDQTNLVAIYCLLLSVLSAVYYIRIITLLFFHQFPVNKFITYLNSRHSSVLSILFCFNIYFFFQPHLLFEIFTNILIFSLSIIPDAISSIIYYFIPL